MELCDTATPSARKSPRSWTHSELEGGLSGLTFMDSAGIGALVVARKRVLSKGLGQLLVTRPGEIVRSALEVVGLSTWIVEWSPDWDE